MMEYSVIPFLVKGADMTIEEVLAQVDELKPNQYSDTIKVSWLSKLDQKVWLEVITRYVKEAKETTDTDEGIAVEADDSGSDTPSMPDTPDHTFDESEEDEDDTFNGYTVYDVSQKLLVDDAYADLYIDYCFAMIDYNNQELDRYANAMMMFNSKYADFKNYYNRTHTIKSNALKVW